MSVLDFGLGIAGLPETTIQEIDKQLPALERIVAAVKDAEPLITKLEPIFRKAWPDIVAVTPLVRDLIAFAKQKEAES